MGKRAGRTIRTVTIEGFDPQGEPEIRVKSNGTLEVMFQFMPPSYAQTPQEQAQYDRFDQKLRSAVGAGVEWEDRECFIVQSAATIVLERLIAYLSQCRSGRYQRMIQIDAMPKTGDAPDEIRQQWVGVQLPLSERVPIQPQKYKRTLTLKSGKTKESWVYAYWVEAHVAIDCLAQLAPEAAEWWRTNKAELYNEQWHLVFDVECSQEVLPTDA